MICKVPSSLLEQLKKMDRWVVVSHQSPDGDTLGCGSAMVSLGRFLDKQVFWYGRDPFPGRFDFLPGRDVYRDGDVNYPLEPSIWVDISTVSRGLPAFAESVAVNIDHHPTNAMFGLTNWVDPTAAATGELVWQVAQSLCEGHVPSDVALGCYVALVTDSGKFSFNSVTAQTLKIASEIVEAGVQPSVVDQKLFHNDPSNRLRLWARVMLRHEVFGDHFVCSYVSSEDFEQTCTTQEDTEDLVQELTRLAKADLVFLAIEAGDRVRCSVRSRLPYSARKFAERWGGGGHELAAGCRIEGPLCQVYEQLKEAMRNGRWVSSDS